MKKTHILETDLKTLNEESLLGSVWDGVYVYGKSASGADVFSVTVSEV